MGLRIHELFIMENHRFKNIGDPKVFEESIVEDYKEHVYVHLYEPQIIYTHIKNRESDAD